LKYKIALSLIPNVGPITAKKLVAYTGSAEEIFKQKKSNLEKIPGVGIYLSEQIINNKSEAIEKAEEELNFIEKYKINVCSYLDSDYPNRLKECEDGPIVFYYKGDTDWNKAKMLAVVGTRNATSYGKEICDEIIKELKNKGHDVTIVSGLAYGIDISSHRAALNNSLDTIAVLAHGLHTIYPSAHKNSAKQIIDNGALITEFSSKSKPDRNNFVRRNRIIAGLSDATIVVESGLKGGALITADIANSYNREVMALPGKNNDKFSAGCNNLIKTNKAALIESAEDIEMLLGWDSSEKIIQPKLFTHLSDEEQIIADILNETEPISIDIICRESKMPINRVSALLLNMEFGGSVKSLPGKQFKLV
jgi:DNA processing protein